MARRNKSTLVVKVMAFLMVLAILVLGVAIAFAADCPMSWKAAPGAIGYRIERSVDDGATWVGPQNTGPCTPNAANECFYTYTGVPETGLILFRVSSLGNGGAVVTRLEAGAWYNHLWKPPAQPGGMGLQ